MITRPHLRPRAAPAAAPARALAPPRRALAPPPPPRRAPRRAARPRVTHASAAAVVEPATGISFPEVRRLWASPDALRCVGAAARVKKVAFIGVKVYAVALYVEADKAARELGVRDRGGFFESDDDFCSALVDGAFLKALAITLARDVPGPQFVEALDEALRPRLALTGDLPALDALKAAFEGKALAKGAAVVLAYRQDGVLDVLVAPPGGGGADLEAARPDASIASPSLCRALFEVYAGQASVVPAARAAWAAGARALLESEAVRRASRKGGSG